MLGFLILFKAWVSYCEITVFWAIVGRSAAGYLFLWLVYKWWMKYVWPWLDTPIDDHPPGVLYRFWSRKQKSNPR